MNFFEKLKKSLQKTRENLTNRLDENIKKEEKINKEFYEELEEILICADVGAISSFEIIENLKENVKQKKLKFKLQAKEELVKIIEEILSSDEKFKVKTTPSIVLMLGVNGVGKTTTIAKLAEYLKEQNKSVIIGAADTFRAAAIEQLEIWANKVNCPLVKQKQGADPAAVVYDTISAAKKRKINVAICDTAGRLHTKKNLMSELEKIIRITNKEAEGLDKEILLVLDATTGQNGLIQAEEFKHHANITGAVLTKLDGTAKGGIIVPIKKKLKLPIKFIATGESLKDLQPFNPNLFTKALFETKEGLKWKL